MNRNIPLGGGVERIGYTPVSLTIDVDGQERTFAVGPLAKRDAIRIAVGQPGFQSGVWRIWSSRNSSDVYIAARNISSMQKWSLHESGDWRHQWCDPEFIETLEDRSDRIIDQWQRPPEIGTTGYTKGFSIYVRHEDVVEIPDAPQQNDVIWIPRPRAGRAAGIHILIARPNAGKVDTGSAGLIPVAAYILPDHKSVLLFRNEFEMTTMMASETKQLVEKTMSLLNSDISWRPGLRLTLSGHDENGGRFAKDIAVTQSVWPTGDPPAGSS